MASVEAQAIQREKEERERNERLARIEAKLDRLLAALGDKTKPDGEDEGDGKPVAKTTPAKGK
ncbi:MAG: hypothetical protein MUF38_05780 [Anaerolineae bacterium]|jgi:hypothetical protein|nr:hypothetical protein [Anaerolineae bacterium]